MLKKFVYFMLAVIACNPVFSSDELGFTDVNVGLKQKFQRDTSTAYLECYYSKSFSDPAVSLRSFLIKPKDGEFKDITVGKIGIKYHFDTKRVEIGALDVDAQYRRCGYGEAAVRTALGIYRSVKNKNLDFNHFYLTVGTGSDREAARNLYFKIGFKVHEDLSSIGYLDLTLDR